MSARDAVGDVVTLASPHLDQHRARFLGRRASAQGRCNERSKVKVVVACCMFHVCACSPHEAPREAVPAVAQRVPEQVAAPTADAVAPSLSHRGGRDLDVPLPPWDPRVVEEIRALARSTHSRALVLLRGNDVVLDETPVGRGPFPVASISKTITALAVARLVDEGVLGFDDTVAATLPEWRDGARDAITLRHIMSHTSGLSPALVPEQPPGGLPRYHLFAYQVIPRIIEQKTGQPFVTYVNAHLMRPAGAADITWRLIDGVVDAGSGAAVTVDDLAALGKLLLHGGFVGDSEVVRARTLDELMRAHGQIARGFGAGLWLQHPRDNALRWDIAEGRGATGNMMSIVPDAGAVLVRIGAGAGDDGVPERFHALLRRLPAPR